MLKLLTLFSIICFSGLSAEWRNSKKAGIKVFIPDGWSIKLKGDDLEARSPDKNVFLLLNVLDDEDDVMKELEKAGKIVEKYHTSVKETRSPQLQKVNNLSIADMQGTAITKKGNKPADWNVAATRNLKGLIIVIMATDSAQKKYENEIKEILTSFQKI